MSNMFQINTEDNLDSIYDIMNNNKDDELS